MFPRYRHGMYVRARGKGYNEKFIDASICLPVLVSLISICSEAMISMRSV